MEVTLLKLYKAKVARIKGQVALPPWYPEETLTVWLDLLETVPGTGTIGFGITIPVKEYTQESLQKTIQEEGSRRLESIVREAEVTRQKEAQKKTQQDALDVVTTKLSKFL